jgi:phage gpG-like protein
MAESAEIDLNMDAWKDVIKNLRTHWDDMKSRKEFQGIVSAAFFKDYIEHFKKEEGPDGPWKEWSKTYADHMQKTGNGGKNILQFNGRLRQSAIVGSGDISSRVQADGLLFYNPAQTNSGFPYAQAHNEGGPKLPKRQFMWLSPNAMSSILTQTVKWLAQAAGGGTQSGAV